MLGNVTSRVFVKLKLEALPKNANQSCKYKIDKHLFSMIVWKSQFSLSDYKYFKTIVRFKLVMMSMMVFRWQKYTHHDCILVFSIK